jgi:hypothetical protein
MNENQRRQRDFEAQRQRTRDDRANQQRIARQNRTRDYYMGRQQQLAREQREAFDRQQAGFDKIIRERDAKNRAEEEYRRQAQAGGNPSSYTSAPNYTSARTSLGPPPNNVIPALVSLFVPGLGQLIQGRLIAALLHFVSCGVLWLIFLGWLMHVFSCVDAARWRGR